MSGSGKGLIGLWLYRTGEEWTLKDPMKKIEAEKKETKSLSEISRNSIVFSLKNRVVGLSKALHVFKVLGVNVIHIESRKNKRRDSEFEILVDIECDNSSMEELTSRLQREISCLSLHDYNGGEEFPPPTPEAQDSFDFSDMCPWFPRKISDLDHFQTVLMYGSDLDADHPGFKDPVYRKRRKEFYDIAMQYKFGDPIPRVEYTEDETKAWCVIFRELNRMYPDCACREYNDNWQELIRHCGYSENNIPQLADVDKYLRTKTGFSLRPVAGYLSPRDFLAGLAFRVFHCTQYIRHSSDPFYTPEPDCCHELLGHMPLLANPSFAQFSQEIGLASLGANDEELLKIATLYFFTIEFGLCKENEKTRAYGAGLLSSIAELKYALSPKAKILSFDPETTCVVPCIVTSFQNQYFLTDTIEDAKSQLRSFVETIHRPFGVRYNPYTQSVDILSNSEKIAALVSELKGELCIVRNALQKIQENDDSQIDSIANMLTSTLKNEKF